MGRASELRIVDPVLTNLAWGYKNAAMVASALFPRVGVDKEAGKIPVFGKEAFKEYNTFRALRGNTNIMPVGSRSTVDVVLDEHDLAYPIDRREKGDSTFDEQKIGQKIVQDAMALRHEIQCALIACTAGSYDAANKVTLSGTTQFSHASSTPIATIETAKTAVAASCGMKPNTMVMGGAVYDTLAQHSTLLDRIKYSMKGVLTLDLMKEIFGIPNIFVGDALKSSDAGVLSKVWSDFVVLAYVAQGSESEHEPSYGYDLGKKGYPLTDVYTSQGGKVDNVRVTDIHKPVMVGAVAGYLISDALI
jgi:hypothetical protein